MSLHPLLIVREIANPFRNFNGYNIEVWNGLVISSNTLLCLWLLILAGIKVDTC